MGGVKHSIIKRLSLFEKILKKSFSVTLKLLNASGFCVKVLCGRGWGPLDFCGGGPKGGGVERTKGKSSGSCPEEAGSTPASITLGKRKRGEEED